MGVTTTPPDAPMLLILDVLYVNAAMASCLSLEIGGRAVPRLFSSKFASIISADMLRGRYGKN